MPASSSTAWIVWLVIILFLIASFGIIIWFAIDSSIPGKTDKALQKLPLKSNYL